MKIPVEIGKSEILGLTIGMFATLIASLIAGGICVKYLESLPFRSLGCGLSFKALNDLLIGLFGGAITISFAALIGALFGGLQFKLNTTYGNSAILLTLGISFFVYILGAAAEEVFFRSYPLQTFFRAGLIPLGIIVTSALFSFAHLGNSDVTYFSIANTLIAGVWFAVAYEKTRSLWLPFGLHFSWNWFQGSVFGMSVSGIKEISEAPLLNAIDTGPTWLTGGHYGIEGGIACTIALLISSAAIMFLPVASADRELLELTSERISTPIES